MKVRRKMLILILATVVTMYMALGICARRGVLFLMGSDRSFFTRSPDEALCFGVKFPFDVSKNIMWLDDSRCGLLWEKILNGENQTCGVHNHVFRMYGQMYIFPKWVDRWKLKHLLLPFAPRILLVYTPSEGYLYISEDCAELGWECSRGWGVSGLSPNMLNVNILDVLRNLEKSGVHKDRYKVLYDIIPDDVPSDMNQN